MSDCVNWKAVSVWAAAVGFQVGTALYNSWKQPKHQRPIETGYEKVQRGETVEGWKLVISPERFRKKHNQSRAATLMPPWRNDDTDLHAAFRHDLSLLIRFIHDTPDGRNVYTLSRYSLIADADRTIARIIYEGKWSYEGTCYLTSRTVAVGFLDIIHFRLRLVLVDITSKRYQMITVACPFEDAINPDILTVRRRDSSENQLSVLYDVQVITADGDLRWEFFDAIYDIPSSEIGPNVVIEPSSSQVLSVPHNEGRVTSWSRNSGFPPIAVIYNDDTPDAVERHLVVSFDQPGNWQITTFANWLESFRNTPIGSRFMNAVDAFGLLSPPESPLWCNIPQLLYVSSRYHDHTCGYENGNAAYANIRYEGGVMRRWINPPSLKYLAAEALCRANPNVSMAELNDRVGCDIFDGMLDKDDAEDSGPVINL